MIAIKRLADRSSMDIPAFLPVENEAEENTHQISQYIGFSSKS